MATIAPALDALVRLLAERPFVAVTGAGCSTESGIPDYRGPDSGPRVPSPIRYRDFVTDPAARRRYWARSALGWPRMDRARPNAAHRALARLEWSGALRGVITQNVDGLHREAGSGELVELHGDLARVTCLDCGRDERRADVQHRIETSNPGWTDRSVEVAPDGDAALPRAVERSFTVPECTGCGGRLKPDVVFFGENVPGDRVEAAWELFEEAEALLVVGSSLSVWSGYRFVHTAAEEGRPVAIVNLGPTRGDETARVRVEARAGEAMPRLARALAREGRLRGRGSRR